MMCKIYGTFHPIATNKVIADRATNAFLKNVSLDVNIKETVWRAKIVLMTIVPLHQVIICLIYFSIWHSLKINKLVWYSGGSCKENIDCGIDRKCHYGKCVQSCYNSLDCPWGKECYDDHCSIPSGNHLCDLLLNLAYRKVARSGLFQLEPHPRIFILFMKRNFDAYAVWPLDKMVQNWIVDWSLPATLW